jgi:hypothetical protein
MGHPCFGVHGSVNAELTSFMMGSTARLCPKVGAQDRACTFPWEQRNSDSLSPVIH